jgi:hypothetical protein
MNAEEYIMRQSIVLTTMLFLVSVDSCGYAAVSRTGNHYLQKKKIRKTTWAHQVGYFIGEIIMDALLLQRYVFSVTTAQVLTGFTPFYIAARSIDEDAQSRFYDPQCHKNTNQLPQSCHMVAKHGVGVPMVLLSSLALFAQDEDLRMTARLFAIGLPFVHFGKNIIKSIDTKACLRPWHEDFSCAKRSSGGFPSGHMANITFAATLFGVRHGLKWGIPLGLFATFVFVDFVNCNRHYISQIIAGAGLGVIYALAANKVVERRLSEKFCICLDADMRGNPTVTCSYTF